MSVALHILKCGAVTPVGLSVPQTCSAIRAGISGFHDAYPLQPPEEPLVGAFVPASKRLKMTPAEWLVNLAARAVSECVENHEAIERTALLVNIPEANRNHPALINLGTEGFLNKIKKRLSMNFHRSSLALQGGHAGGIAALCLAREHLMSGKVDYCLVGGVDSLLNGEDVRRFQVGHRIHVGNCDGLVPGEGSAFVLISKGRPKENSNSIADVLGIGLTTESDTVLGSRYSKGRALQNALRTAVTDAAICESAITFRVSDMNGERYRAWESLLAETRFYQTRRKRLPCYYTASCVGDLGAAAGALLLVVTAVSIYRGYAPGSFGICEASSDEGLRAACVVADVRDTA